MKNTPIIERIKTLEDVYKVIKPSIEQLKLIKYRHSSPQNI